MTEARKPRIRRIELTPLHVPFRAEVRQMMGSSTGGLGMALKAEEPWLGGDFVICKLVADDGSEGLGEAFVWLPETGATPEQLVETVAKGLARYVLGESPFDVQRLRRRLDDNVARSEIAKGLVDIACYDLMGTMTGRPAHDFMGGRCAESLPTAGLVPLVSVEMMVAMAQHFQTAGHRTLRLKLGAGIEEDREIVAKVREAVGPSMRLRVDYNQVYTPEQAIRAIAAIAPFGIDCAEQPVRSNDILGMVRVQKAVTVPLMAHEACFTLREIVEQVELGAVGVIGINAERPGGVTDALAAIDYAARRGLGVVMHNQPLGIGSAMQVHVG
ncbi:MAG: mandelate racemase/muconate lactonizing enzyme family protein, partial [Polyangiaceae bacterium]|nr:mandelate racemase/muconate lactonizing enzyme family protein [Polyangiaceae bacterium]